VRIQNNTENCEARKGHLEDETSPILPTPPILDPFALVGSLRLTPRSPPWST